MPTIHQGTGERTIVGGINYESAEKADREDRGYQINEYELTREYGGQEEGDWWYNLYIPTGNSVVLHPACDWEDAREVLEDLRAYADITNKNENPRGIYSVIGGIDIVWRIETHEPRRDPEFPPHYE